MLRNKPIMGIISLITSVLLLTGCYKNKTVISNIGEEITRTVTFNGDIIPVFNASCNLSGCHSPGSKSPDLSAANAFTNLTNGNYINTSEPENSILYQWMTGKKETPMPVSGINKDFNALVLAWIRQGAQNN